MTPSPRGGGARAGGAIEVEDLGPRLHAGDPHDQLAAEHLEVKARLGRDIAGLAARSWLVCNFCDQAAAAGRGGRSRCCGFPLRTQGWAAPKACAGRRSRP